MSQAAKLTLNVNGKKYNIEARANETVLEAALRNDIDVPYACMSGTCNSCQGHLDKGEVAMEYSDALSKQEIAQGEILTCQARAKTTEVEVTYP